MRSIPDGEKWLWSPAEPDRQAKRQMIALQQLPDLLRRFNELEKSLAAAGACRPKRSRRVKALPAEATIRFRYVGNGLEPATSEPPGLIYSPSSGEIFVALQHCLDHQPSGHGAAFHYSCNLVQRLVFVTLDNYVRRNLLHAALMLRVKQGDWAAFTELVDNRQTAGVEPGVSDVKRRDRGGRFGASSFYPGI